MAPRGGETTQGVLSPQAELTFCTGDIISVFGEIDEDGFYYVSVRRVRALHAATGPSGPQCPHGPWAGALDWACWAEGQLHRSGGQRPPRPHQHRFPRSEGFVLGLGAAAPGEGGGTPGLARPAPPCGH